MKSNREAFNDFLKNASEENIAVVRSLLVHWAEERKFETLNEQVNLMQEKAADVIVETMGF